MKKNISILFIFHDAALTGANLVLFRYVKFLSQQNGFILNFILGRDGKLVNELEKTGKVCIARQAEPSPGLLKRAARKLGANADDPVQKKIAAFAKACAPDLLYFNTALSIPFVSMLADMPALPAILHIHELEMAWEILGQDLGPVKNRFDLFVANSKATESFMINKLGADPSRIRIHYPSLPVTEKNNISERGERDNRFVVGSCGTGLGRKGVFLFVELCAILKRKAPERFRFMWVGNIAPSRTELMYDVRKAELEEDIIFTGETNDPREYFRKMDVFVSLSREESFGLACVEAAHEGLPLIGFSSTGGAAELISACGGTLVSYLDLGAMASELMKLSNDKPALERMKLASLAESEKYLDQKIIPLWIETLVKAAADH